MTDYKKICAALSGPGRDYCEALVDSCLAPVSDGARIKLDLLNGTSEYFDYQDECASHAKYRASFGAPAGFRKPTGALPATPARTAVPGIALPMPGTASFKSLTARCETVAAKGSEAHGQCLTYMGICDSSATGPYQIEYKGKVQPVSYKDECISLSLFYTRILNQGAGSTAVAPSSEGLIFLPDGEKRHAIGIKAAGFSPELSGKVQSKDLTLKFGYDWEIFGVKVRIAYKLEKAGSDYYTLRYAMLNPSEDEREDIGIGELKDSITFKVAGSKIVDPIGFGVTLNEPGNFANVSSVKLVKIKQ